MLEVQIERNPGEIPKSVKVARELIGNGQNLVPPNFEEMFKKYRFGKNEHFGTKADVIDIRKLVGYLSDRHSLHPGVYERVIADSVIGSLINPSGHLSCFWNLPTEIHHRDIMRYCVGRVADCIDGLVMGEKQTRMYGVGLEDAQLDLLVSLDELAEAKISSATKIGETSRKILELSQGYVLYSEEPSNADDLWRSRLYRLKLESKITKDQRERGAMPSSEDTHRNVITFIDALKGVELKTHRLFLPECHVIPASSIPVVSSASRRGGGQWPIGIIPLKIHYENGSSGQLKD